MDPQSQAGEIIAMIISASDSHFPGPSTISFERHLSTFPEPSDRVPCSRNPRISLPEIFDDTAITFAPQSLWCEATIMPVDCQATSEPDRVVPQSVEKCL